jgi:phage FluMu protein Com
MQIRCYKCNWSFAIRKDEIAFVIDALEESEDQHYDVPCPRCRTINKISVEQMRQVVPRSRIVEEETETTAEAEPEVEQEEADEEA